MHCRDTSVTRVHTVGVYVSIDGQQCSASSLRNSAESYPNTKDTVSISDVQVSNTTAKPFIFSTVRLTGSSTRHDFKYRLTHGCPDEDEFVDVSSAGLGQIQIKVYPIALGHAMNAGGYQIQTEHKVHERSKKAVTHCVG